jgi:MFS family permease
MARKSAINRVLLRSDFLSVFIVVVNAFSWYFPLYVFLESTLEKSQVGPTFLRVAFGVQLVAIVGSAMVGTALVKKFPNRDAFLSVWMFLGIITSILMVTLETSNMVYILIVSLLSGISLGLGFPSCLAYFGDYSIEENRGRLAGITFFGSSLCMFFISLLLSFSTLVVGALILAAWRGIGLFLFLLARWKQDYHKENMIEVSYRSVLLHKPLLLYLVPWIMFCLINFLERPVVTTRAPHDFFGEDVALFMSVTEFGIGGFVALLNGWFADSVGRKRVVIFGFIILGIGYAVLGLFSSIIFSWYLYLILDGVAWGIFTLVFYLVIWAELAGNRIKEKYYLIGVLPFIVSSYIEKLLSPTPYAELIPVSAAFSLASFFLFVAVLPLIYAPETLPEKKIELRRLRKYVDKAKEVREKHEEMESV